VLSRRIEIRGIWIYVVKHPGIDQAAVVRGLCGKDRPAEIAPDFADRTAVSVRDDCPLPFRPVSRGLVDPLQTCLSDRTETPCDRRTSRAICGSRSFPAQTARQQRLIESRIVDDIIQMPLISMRRDQHQ